MRYQSRLVVAPLQREEAEAFPPGHESRVLRTPGKGREQCLGGMVRAPGSCAAIVPARCSISTKKRGSGRAGR